MNRSACAVWSGFCVTLGNTTKVPMVMGHTDLPGRCVKVLLKTPVADQSLLASAAATGVTITLGAAACHPDEPVESAIRRADVALYEGKAAGRNRVVMAPPCRSQAAQEKR